jgi:hypothetical protein
LLWSSFSEESFHVPSFDREGKDMKSEKKVAIEFWVLLRIMGARFFSNVVK